MLSCDLVLSACALRWCACKHTPHTAKQYAEDLDRAVLDRVDEQLEVALPDTQLREQLLHLYFGRYVRDAAANAAAGLTLRQRMGRGLRALLRGTRLRADDIDVAGFDAVRALAC